MKIGLIGASGKMGKEILAAAHRLGLQLLPYFRSEPNFETYFKPEYRLEDIFNNSSVLINFSPEIYYEFSARYLKPTLLCSTGHSDLHSIENPPFPFMYAPNVSVEWSILKDTIEKISNYGDFEICIDDIHHSFKKDAPSGTAKDLLLKEEAKIRSIRSPDVSSWHIVSFFNRDQVIRIEHQVLKRSVYAESALKVAAWLARKAPGKYEMRDFLNEIA